MRQLLDYELVQSKVIELFKKKRKHAV